ncbi:hypothetical protein QR680_018742 [Steinernema hermaphroditum]|uniref:Major facilitator superfamily (MFS) profile domain-containing protein n=1 Tax=Steinernema hermaphroditum TaxID=289476 RepID=A0AA39LRH4_9BILA|nr:hypothetical protein QR680_018742 [Steinernema hermaphroditum]
MELLPDFYFFNLTRFVVLLVTTLCLSVVVSNTIVLNFTIICMADVPGEYDNGTVDIESESVQTSKYSFSTTQRAWLFSIIAIGNLVGTIPVMKFGAKIGVRYMFPLFGFLSAAATALLPLAASLGYGWLLAARFVEGFSMSIIFPTMGTIATSWSSRKQAGLFMALLTTCVQFAAIFTMPVAGELCTSSAGWPAAFYLHSGITFIFFSLFFVFYRNSPEDHKCVGPLELATILEGKTSSSFGTQSVPYKAIFTSLPIWGVWISYIGGGLGYNLFVQFGPTYLNKVLHFEVSNAGIAGAFPYILAAISKILSGPISDYSSCVSQRVRIIFFTFLSQGQMAVCILVIAFLGESASTAAFICYTLAINSSGITTVATMKSGQLVACQHVHFVMSILNIINSLLVLLLPPFVAALAPDNSHSQWSTIFLVSGIIVAVTNLFFVFVCRAEPAEWTKSEAKKSLIYPDTVPSLERFGEDGKKEANAGESFVFVEKQVQTNYDPERFIHKITVEK